MARKPLLTRRNRRDWFLWRQKKGPKVLRIIVIGLLVLLAVGLFLYSISREASIPQE